MLQHSDGGLHFALGVRQGVRLVYSLGPFDISNPNTTRRKLLPAAFKKINKKINILNKYNMRRQFLKLRFFCVCTGGRVCTAY